MKKQDLNLGFFGLFFCIGSSFQSVCAAGNPPQDVPIPNPVIRSVTGEYAVQSLNLALQPSRIGFLVSQFKPLNTGLIWDLQSITFSEDLPSEIVTRFTIHLSPDQSPQLSPFRIVTTVPSDQPSIPPARKSRTFYSSLVGFVTGAFQQMSQVISKYLVGKLIGEIRVYNFPCDQEFSPSGIFLDVDFHNSTSWIYSQIQKMKVHVCYKGSEDGKKVVFQVRGSFVSGESFPGIEESQLGPFFQAQLEAWGDALQEVVASVDAEQVHQAFLNQ